MLLKPARAIQTTRGADGGARSILALVGIALVCATLLAGTRALTEPHISANHAMHAQQELRALLGREVDSIPENWIDGSDCDEPAIQLAIRGLLRREGQRPG